MGLPQDRRRLDDPRAAAGATTPDVGYAEFAGWVPGGKQMLVAREAQGEGKYKRIFEVLRLDTLATERQACDPGAARRVPALAGPVVEAADT